MHTDIETIFFKMMYVVLSTDLILVLLKNSAKCLPFNLFLKFFLDPYEVTKIT